MGDKEVFDKTVRKALKGDVEAKFKLGYAYYCGKFGDYVFEKDTEKSTLYFKEAADMGHSAAQNNYGVACFYGLGTSKNEAESKIYFEKAIDSGSITAQYNLANLWKKGFEGQLPDEEKALELYSSAADCGLPHAQYALACAYSSGMGLGKDRRLATLWLQLAAEQDYGPAQTKLARAYIHGNKHINGPNLQKAALWSTMAEKNKLFPIFNIKHKMNLTEIYDEPVPQSDDVQCDDCPMEYDNGEVSRFDEEERILLKSNDSILVEGEE